MQLASALLVAATLALAAEEDDLAKALRAISQADSYAFTLRESGDGAVEGKYQKDRPASFTADRIDFFKKGDALVYQQGGTWQKAKTGTQSDPLAILGASAKVRGARLPHEELGDLAKHLRNVKKAEEKKHTVYSAELTERGAQALAKPADREIVRGGTAKLWVDGQGRLTRYEITVRLKGRRGNADVDGEASRTVTIKDVGGTKVDVPDEVRKLLE
jgi:hypothetical protein